MKATTDIKERIAAIIEPPVPAPIAVVVAPFKRFVSAGESGGVVLIVCTLIALVWANSGWHHFYHDLWESHLSIGLGSLSLDYSLHHWINDGLMAVFFFYVGLEIKREVLIGELASVRNAALPIAAAIGGMVVPALIYLAFNAGSPTQPGWGIPMATDIAFALGILALVGRGLPIGLTVFLTALAIVDDLGAVLVIALFYGGQLSIQALLVAAALLGLLALLNRLGVRAPLVYGIVGVLIWLAFLKSGIHATIAGVLTAFTIPARTVIDARRFHKTSQTLLDDFEALGVSERDILGIDAQEAIVEGLETACEQVQSPLNRMLHSLSVWVAFFIMPLFALANAGIVLDGDIADTLGSPVTIGVALGLLLGKTIGVTLASWLAVRTGLGALPTGVTWRQIVGAAVLAGIGFTMSLFIASLAFTDEAALMSSKLGILLGSTISAIGGWLVLRKAGAARAATDAPTPLPK